MVVRKESPGNITMGEAEVKPTDLVHVPGVRSGNKPGSYEKEPGHLADGHSTARRSTGINAKRRNPILPQMPNLSPP